MSVLVFQEEYDCACDYYSVWNNKKEHVGDIEFSFRYDKWRYSHSNKVAIGANKIKQILDKMKELEK